MNDLNDTYKNFSFLQKTTPTDLAAKNPPNKKDFEQNSAIDYTLSDFHQTDLSDDTDTLSYFLFI